MTKVEKRKQQQQRGAAPTGQRGEPQRRRTGPADGNVGWRRLKSSSGLEKKQARERLAGRWLGYARRSGSPHRPHSLHPQAKKEKEKRKGNSREKKRTTLPSVHSGAESRSRAMWRVPVGGAGGTPPELQTRSPRLPVCGRGPWPQTTTPWRGPPGRRPPHPVVALPMPAWHAWRGCS